MSVALPTAIVALIQQNLLQRKFEKALFPNQLWRTASIKREPWEAHLGQTLTETRTGLYTPNTQPRTPGQDPTPRSAYAVEQWTVTAGTYNDTNDTHMPTSQVSIASLFLENMEKLALLAGQTLNHAIRNKLYNAYLGGQTYVTASQSSSTSIPVATIAGFGTVLVNGVPTPVSGAAPLNITINGVANTVTGATPNDPNQPNGAGTLTVGTAVAVTQGQPVIASNAPKLVRVGGGSTSNALTSSNTLTLAAIRVGVAYLRTQNVPTFPDGYYHMHLDPTSEAQLFADPEFQSIYRGQAGKHELKDNDIAYLMGVRFIRDNEVPNSINTSSTDFVCGDMVTASFATQPGMNIHRPLLLGYGAIMEKQIDESKYITEAGVLGKVGEFSHVATGGVQIMLDGIRYIVRAPQDRLQNTVAQTYSWSGDWAIPTDSVAGVPAYYKRAVSFEHGE